MDLISAIEYQISPRIYELLTAPFELHEIEWVLMSVSSDNTRGLYKPRAKQSAIVNRLDTTIGSEHWKYDLSPQPQGVTCHLTILKKTMNSTYEDEQGAFIQAAAKFGLGRNLERIVGIWLDCDPANHKPLEMPHLPEWAFAKPKVVLQNVHT